jgi:glycosyltransferase involved in cell wall biosynthesis
VNATVAPGSKTSPTPLISVVIPVYQGESLIAGAVESVLTQTYHNIEVFVVDDGSTDATVAILQRIKDPRLIVLCQKNAGTAAARNLAIERCMGEYIAFLDSDDRWLPEKLAIELAVANERAEPAIVYSSYYPVDDRGRLLNFPKRNVHSGRILDALLDGEDFLVPSVCLFHRRVFETIGSFNAGQYHEDHEFILRAARAFPIYPTGKTLVVYRQSTSGKCRSILGDFDRARKEELQVVEAVRDALTSEQQVRLLRNAYRSLYSRFLMYGFNRHAKALSHDVDLDGLCDSAKGKLAWLFAKTGINLLVVARIVIQTYYRFAMQGSWKKTLARARTTLRYE